MIKNALPAALALVAALALPACRARRSVPEGFQGVVEHEERVLAFEVPGRIEKVEVRRGDAVDAGAVLAESDDTLARLAQKARADEASAARADLALLRAGARREDVAALAAQLEGARATEALLSKAADRARALRDSGSVSQAELDRALADLDRASHERESLEQRLASLRRGARTEEIARAQARLEAATSALSLEEERAARHVLRATSRGDVLDVLVEPGELAAAGTPAFVLADTTHPYVDVFVPQGDLAGIAVGRKAEARVDTGELFTGAVEHVSQRTEFTPRYLFSDRERPNLVVRVRVRLEDPERRLHAGVPAFVRIER